MLSGITEIEIVGWKKLVYTALLNQGEKNILALKKKDRK